MEFLKALEIAREQHGLTKEQFVKVWSFEAKLKLMSEEARTLENTEQRTRNSVDSYTVDALKEIMDLTTRDMHQFHHALQEKVQELSHKLVETNENLIGMKKDVLSKQEFKSEVQLMDRNILQTMDSHSNSVKSYFTQDCQSLSQNIEKKLSCVDSVEPYMAQQLRLFKRGIEGKLENIENSGQDGKTRDGQQVLKDKGSSDTDENVPQLLKKMQMESQEFLNKVEQQKLSEHLQQQQTPTQEKQQQSGEGKKHIKQQQQQRDQIVPHVKSNGSFLPQLASGLSNLNSDRFSLTTRPTASNDSEIKNTNARAGTTTTGQQHLPRSTVKLASLTSSKDSSWSSSCSTADTGSMSDATNSQHNGKTTGTSGKRDSLHGRQPVSFADAVANFTRKQRDASYRLMPPHGTKFKLQNASDYVTSKSEFFTSYFYTRPSAAKVRLRLKFDADGRLCVHVLVSEGVFDNQQSWPMILSGTGYILHKNSRRYTKLWEVTREEVSRPQGGEVIEIEPFVCLCTSRGAHTVIKFWDLAQRKYEDRDALAFKWDMEAEELKD